MWCIMEGGLYSATSDVDSQKTEANRMNQPEIEKKKSPKLRVYSLENGGTVEGLALANELVA